MKGTFLPNETSYLFQQAISGVLLVGAAVIGIAVVAGHVAIPEADKQVGSTDVNPLALNRGEDLNDSCRLHAKIRIAGVGLLFEEKLDQCPEEGVPADEGTEAIKGEEGDGVKPGKEIQQR